MSNNKTVSFDQIITYILYGIPLAMGVATTILSIIQPATNMTFALGLGMACLAIAGLDLLDKGEES
ncbi:MAG: hypothetical protein ACW98F_05000 [Candidatus Hodarchaeales archaeon]|jgi:hypothetical protein